jgi:tartrate dehydratase alpha subunit/fumarate hydratase class I-like protein
MFSGLGGEKVVFQGFVFNNFSGLGGRTCGGHHVAVGVARCWPFD